MKESEKLLLNYYEKYKIWSEDRIKNLYNDLKKGEVVSIYTVPLDSQDFVPKELQWCTNEVKPSEFFINVTPKQIGDFIFYFWDENEDYLKIKDKNNEYEEFKEWFKKIRTRDMSKNGLALRCGRNHRYFIVTINEMKKNYGENSFLEMYDALEEEGVI